MSTAQLEYDNENYVKTLEICHELLSENPDDSHVLLLLTSSYINCQEYDISMSYLIKAYNLDCNCPGILKNLGYCHFHKAEYVEALRYFSSALVFNNSCEHFWIACTRKLMKNHESDIRSAYLFVLHNKPDLCDIRSEYIKYLVSINEVKQAEHHYKILVEINPSCVDIWNNYGDLLFDSDRFKEALDCYKKALKLNNTWRKTWNNLGSTYIKLEEVQNAIDSFQKALELYPQDTDALKNIASLYHFQKKFSLAIDNFEEVLKILPNDECANLQLGLLYYNRLKDYKEAGKYFKTLLKLNPLNVDYHKYLIVAYQKQKQFQSASEAIISLGDVYYDQNDYETAKTVYESALKLDRENAICHYKLGITLLNLRLFELALQR